MTELTPRQQEILARVERGLSNKEIASDLGISEAGVKAHLSRLLLRYRVANRVALLRASRADRDGAVARDGYDSVSADLDMIGKSIASLNARGVDLDGGLSTLRRIDSDTQRAFEAGTARLSSGAAATVGQSIAELRASLAGLQLAFDLADRLPPEAVRGPVLDVLRDRVQKALSATEALDGALVAQGAPDRRSTRRPGSRRASPARTR